MLILIESFTNNSVESTNNTVRAKEKAKRKGMPFRHPLYVMFWLKEQPLRLIAYLLLFWCKYKNNNSIICNDFQ